MNKVNYTEFVRGDAGPGSDVAETYIHALELFDGIIRRIHVFDLEEFWSVESAGMVERLTAYAAHFEHQAASAFMRPDMPQDYGPKGLFSAALKSYQLYLEQM